MLRKKRKTSFFSSPRLCFYCFSERRELAAAPEFRTKRGCPDRIQSSIVRLSLSMYKIGHIKRKTQNENVFTSKNIIHSRVFSKIIIHRIHKWRTRGKKLGPSHESEALEGKQKLQMKTFSELAECLARIPPKITLYGRFFFNTMTWNVFCF